MTQTYIQIGTQTINRDDVTAPHNRDFRAAWNLNGPIIEIDMIKARNIFRDKLRQARSEAFKPLDDLYRQKTEELIPLQAAGGDITVLVAEIEVISQQKQALRDATQDPAIEAAQTPEALIALRPAGLVVT